MINKWVVLTVLAVGFLWAGGVLEVSMKTDELSQAPGRVWSLVQGAEGGRLGMWLTNVKRDGEQWIIKDEQQKIQVAVQYVKDDAEQLVQIAQQAHENSSSVLAHADLLLDSVARVDEVSGKATADNVAALRDEIRTSFVAAKQAMGELKELQEEYSSLKERFASSEQSIEWRVGDIPDGAVAGASNEGGEDSPNTGPKESHSDDSVVPLEF